MRRIQAIDGGFFEKFGAILGQKSKEMLASASLRNIGFGTKFTAAIPPRFAEEGNNIDPESIHEDIISQLENPTAKRDDVIKEYSGLNVRKHKRAQKLSSYQLLTNHTIFFRNRK